MSPQRAGWLSTIFKPAASNAAWHPAFLFSPEVAQVLAANSEDDVEGQMNVFETMIQSGEYVGFAVAPLSDSNLVNTIVEANEKGYLVADIDERVNDDQSLPLFLQAPLLLLPLPEPARVQLPFPESFRNLRAAPLSLPP